MNRWKAGCLAGVAALGTAALAAGPSASPPAADLQGAAFTLLKNRCVRCHGPARQEGGLSLAVPPAIRRGGASGPSLSNPPEQSRLWQRVAANQMPPDEPLSASEKETLRRWLRAGAPGVPARVATRPAGDEHWASQALRPVSLPPVRDASRVRTPIDRFIQAELETHGLTLGPEAPPEVLIRRVAFDLTGLPPTPAEVETFLREYRGEALGREGVKALGKKAAISPTPRSAYERMVDRYLASPHYGERWGKYWLDAAGYADSNGYFNADTDRPLAYRYRDYVVRSLNADKPWDQFIREQLAGDELVGYHPGRKIEAGMVEALEATHFLRNSQDGTDSSDGNPDERRADKYAVLEGTEQIIGSSLLGLTVQCARCHDHKFEPFSQRDYYALQAVLYPAFNVENWVTPGKRQMEAVSPDELAAWERKIGELDQAIAGKRQEWAAWRRQNREPSRVLFEASFDAPGQRLEAEWSNTAPGDSQPAGTPPVQVDSPAAPGAQIREGRLLIRESGSAGDRALSTRRAFNWTPEGKGAWVQATFDLVAEGTPAPYVGYFLALRDFSGASGKDGGNVLLDGAAAGRAAVHVGYPARSSARGQVGKSGYTPGRNYGVRVTNVGNGQFEVTQVVDGLPEAGTVRLSAADLPAGGFGFEYCCGRSFTVDNVCIETGDGATGDAAQREAFRKKRAEFEAAVQALEARKPPRPGKLAAVTDLSPQPPRVPFLVRGDYKSPQGTVEAAAPAALSEARNPADLSRRAPEVKETTGRRLAFARWLTEPGTRASARLARVTVNRIWQHHFGTGLVATPDNLGYSGAAPTHPELLEWLAGRFAGVPSSEPRLSSRTTVDSRLGTPGSGLSQPWSSKSLHRMILLSAVYRQSSIAGSPARTADADNRLLSRFPLRRLDAEAVRDGMLTVSGELDPALGGPYVSTSRNGEGEVVVAEEAPGARRRSLYLQQRRTQVTSLLDVFDAPTLVFNCTFRNPTTVPLQSLTLLNSAFVRARAAAFAKRLEREAGADRTGRLRLAFLLTRSRPPGAAEIRDAEAFLTAQAAEYSGDENRAWIDFCQALLAENAFLYIE